MSSPPFWIVLGLTVTAIGLLIVIYNVLVGLRNDIERAWANVDVILQQRHDEVGNLVAAVRDFMAYEQALLTELTQARARLAQARSIADKARQNAALEASLRHLYAAMEAYPDLKSNHLVLELMRRLSSLEEALANRREMYNHTVTRFNTLIASFPIILVSGWLGFRDRALFEAEPAARSAPSLKIAS